MNVLDLCSGYGGMSLGLRLANPTFRTVCYVEREAFCQALLVARMEEEALDPAPVWDDATTFDGRVWRGVVDLVSAGYPCQPFSIAGKGLGAGDERHLWPHILRIVSEVQPRFVFCENVDRHLTLGFEQVLGDLQELGYSVEAGLFSAAEVGAGHLRKRLFFLAHHHHEGCRGLRGDGVRDRVGLDREGAERGGHADGCRCAEAAVGLPLGVERDGRAGEPGGGGLEWEMPGRVQEAGVPPGPVSVVGLLLGNGRLEAEREARDPGCLRQPALTVETMGHHHHHPGCEGRCLHGCGCSYELPAWPPGPEDTLEWSRVPGCLLPAEPKLQRMVDGPASRVDRLHAIGNGVVPLCVAHAFIILARRAGVWSGVV